MYTTYLLGLGRIGAAGINGSFSALSEYTHLGHLKADKRFRLVGIWDSDPHKQTYISQRPEFSNLLNSNYTELNPEVIVIATPPETHFELVTRILKNCSPKMLVCEKPFGNSMEQAIKMRDLIFNSGVRCIVNYPRSISFSESRLLLSVKHYLQSDKQLFVGITISDRSNSSTWHLFNLLLKIDKRFSKLIFRSYSTNDIKYFNAQYENLTLALTILDRDVESFGEIQFIMEDQVIWLMDGFSKIYTSSSNNYFGWKQFPQHAENTFRLLKNPMNILYSEVFRNLNLGDVEYSELDSYILTHFMIENLNSAIK